MAATPEISVILPCRDAGATLVAAVQSIQRQTFSNWELIVFDDGSTDDSLDRAESSARSDSRIRVVASGYLGIVGALNEAASLARGRFLARMDADDIARPNRLASQLDYMTTHAEIGLCGTLVNMTGTAIAYGRRRYETWINTLISHTDIERELFVECPIPHPTFFLRRDLFDRLNGYADHGWAEDYDLLMRAWLDGARFGKVPETHLDWTESVSRLSMVDERYSARRFRDLKRYYLERSFLGNLLGSRAFLQWGAGEVGKRWLREWTAAKPVAVVDINPRKVGRSIHGIPVIPPELLPAPGAARVLVTVGAPDARQEIRDWFNPRGYSELDDYVFLA